MHVMQGTNEGANIADMDAETDHAQMMDDEQVSHLTQRAYHEGNICAITAYSQSLTSSKAQSHIFECICM